MAWLALDHGRQRLARGTFQQGDHQGAADEGGGDERGRTGPAPTQAAVPPGRGGVSWVTAAAVSWVTAASRVTAAAWVTAASSPGCSGRPRARMASARAAASAADRRMPRSAHQEHVPAARLPITIPAIVPTAPIRLPRIAASTVPVVAATMAGRCERKLSGLACGLDSGLAVSLVMISRRVMAHRRAGRCEESTGYPLSRSARRDECHRLAERHEPVTPGPEGDVPVDGGRVQVRATSSALRRGPSLTWSPSPPLKPSAGSMPSRCRSPTGSRAPPARGILSIAPRCRDWADPVWAVVRSRGGARHAGAAAAMVVSSPYEPRRSRAVHAHRPGRTAAACRRSRSGLRGRILPGGRGAGKHPLGLAMCPGGRPARFLRWLLLRLPGDLPGGRGTDPVASAYACGRRGGLRRFLRPRQGRSGPVCPRGGGRGQA